MRAVVLDRPGSAESLTIRDLPIPEVRPGWILIRVRAFGLNRSELHTRLGLSDGVTFPRVLWIEAVGDVADGSDSGFAIGQTRLASRDEHDPAVAATVQDPVPPPAASDKGIVLWNIDLLWERPELDVTEVGWPTRCGSASVDYQMKVPMGPVAPRLAQG
jgi:Alcohol dehydrogenase GroES-like domain